MAFRTEASLVALAAKARDAGLDRVLTKRFAADVLDELRRGNGRDWVRELQAFLSEFGHRVTAGHLDLSTETWFEDPTPVVETILSYLPMLEGGWDIARVRADVAAKQERDLRELLERVPHPDAPDRVRLARELYRFQEEHGFYIDQGSTAALRYAVIACGAALAREGLLQDQGEVLFLTYAELVEIMSDLVDEPVIATRHHAGLVGPLVEERRAAWEAAFADAPELFIGNVPDHIDDPIAIRVFGLSDSLLQCEAVGGAAPSQTLHGHGAAPGRVTAVARVVDRPESLGKVNPGEILVCPGTTTAWTPLFPKIAGVVTDTGGTLCHAAIAAREYGIPAVVGTWTASRTIKTGQRLRIDGNHGTVEILES